MSGWSAELEERWRAEWGEVVMGLKEWRQQQPKATYREIERAVDERLARLRAHLLEAAVLASAAADVRQMRPTERPRCPQCGGLMEAHGQETRRLTTNYEQSLTLHRSALLCPRCHEGLFPPR